MVCQEDSRIAKGKLPKEAIRVIQMRDEAGEVGTEKHLEYFLTLCRTDVECERRSQAGSRHHWPK